MQVETEGLCTIEDFDATLIPVEILPCDVMQRTRGGDALSIVELGKQLLYSAKNGDTDMVRDLMCRGAPFTTDWVIHKSISSLNIPLINSADSTNVVLLLVGNERPARGCSKQSLGHSRGATESGNLQGCKDKS